MELVCFQGLDKENWSQINALIKRGNWDKAVIVKNSQAENFPTNPTTITLPINTTLPLLELKQEIMNKLKPIIGKDFEVALSIASGSGKENMALISALLSIPVGIRFVAFTKEGVQFIN